MSPLAFHHKFQTISQQVIIEQTPSTKCGGTTAPNHELTAKKVTRLTAGEREKSQGKAFDM